MTGSARTPELNGNSIKWNTEGLLIIWNWKLCKTILEKREIKIKICKCGVKNPRWRLVVCEVSALSLVLRHATPPLSSIPTSYQKLFFLQLYKDNNNSCWSMYGWMRYDDWSNERTTFKIEVLNVCFRVIITWLCQARLEEVHTAPSPLIKTSPWLSPGIVNKSCWVPSLFMHLPL